MTTDQLSALLAQDPAAVLEHDRRLYEQQIVRAADLIAAHAQERPAVLLAGPSGSGKTTTALLIERELDRRGMETHTLSMDDYFCPLTERELELFSRNELDLERPSRVDVPFFQEQLGKLLAGEEVELPHYDFKNSVRVFDGRTLRRRPGELVILEGIHALNDACVNKGMGYGEKIVRFRKDTLYKKVWVMTYDPRITSPEGDRITRSVRDNYRETAIEQFPIDAYGKDSASVVIKVNKVFDGSEKSFNNVFGSIVLPGSPKKALSKIESVKSVPENINVKSLLSTSHTEEGTTLPLTVEITSNLVLLAREPMRPRFSDDRVGYFEIGHLYFNDEQQKAEERAFINRWRLEPKPEDVERY